MSSGTLSQTRNSIKGGFRPIILETLIMRYGLKGKARTHYVPTFLGWFWVHAHNFTHLRPRSKNGAKYQNDRVMPINAQAQKWFLAYFGP